MRIQSTSEATKHRLHPTIIPRIDRPCVTELFPVLLLMHDRQTTGRFMRQCI